MPIVTQTPRKIAETLRKTDGAVGTPPPLRLVSAIGGRRQEMQLGDCSSSSRLIVSPVRQSAVPTDYRFLVPSLASPLTPYSVKFGSIPRVFFLLLLALSLSLTNQNIITFPLHSVTDVPVRFLLCVQKFAPWRKVGAPGLSAPSVESF